MKVLIVDDDRVLAFDLSGSVEGESGAVYVLLSQLVIKNPDTHTKGL